MVRPTTNLAYLLMMLLPSSPCCRTKDASGDVLPLKLPKSCRWSSISLRLVSLILQPEAGKAALDGMRLLRRARSLSKAAGQGNDARPRSPYPAEEARNTDGIYLMSYLEQGIQRSLVPYPFLRITRLTSRSLQSRGGQARIALWWPGQKPSSSNGSLLSRAAGSGS